jgi:hypothetical protein
MKKTHLRQKGKDIGINTKPIYYKILPGKGKSSESETAKKHSQQPGKHQGTKLTWETTNEGCLCFVRSALVKICRWLKRKMDGSKLMADATGKKELEGDHIFMRVRSKRPAGIYVTSAAQNIAVLTTQQTGQGES